MVLGMEPTFITADQIVLASQAYAFENITKNLDKRNEYAVKLFKQTRNVSFKNEHGALYRVETWFDRQSRNYITSSYSWHPPKGDDGYWGEEGDSHYTGDLLGAAIAHLWAITAIMFPKS